jgi:hypothetical protein
MEMEHVAKLRARTDPGKTGSAGEEVSKKAAELIKSKAAKEYSEAVSMVLGEDAALARKYYAEHKKPVITPEPVDELAPDPSDSVKVAEEKEFLRLQRQFSDEALVLHETQGIALDAAQTRVMRDPRNRWNLARYNELSDKLRFMTE